MKVSKKVKRLWSIVLSAAMAFSMGMTSFAEENETPPTTNYVAWIGDVGYSSLEAAVSAAESGAVITLGEGQYFLYERNCGNNKSLTFEGVSPEKTTWLIGTPKTNQTAWGELNSDYSFDCRGTKDIKETVTFKNMTLQAGAVMTVDKNSQGAVINPDVPIEPTGAIESRDYTGFSGMDYSVVEDCVVKGKTTYWGYYGATFKNTTFNAPADDYAMWVGASSPGYNPVWTFEDCTFNVSGKVLNLYRHYPSGDETPVTVNYKNCSVISRKPNKSVLNIKDRADDWIINISGINTVTELNPNSTTCSRLFQVEVTEEDQPHYATVNIDGTTVWDNGKMINHAIDTANDKYTDGYEDNAFEMTYGKWEEQADGSSTRTVTKVCKYCGYTETLTETQVKEKTGSLKISKNVVGETNQSIFTFDVALTKDGITNNRTVEVAAGSSTIISDIPAGTTYTVTEAEANIGCTTTATNDSGTIMDGQISVAVFTNNYTFTPVEPPVDPTAGVMIKAIKMMDNEEAQGSDFAFELLEDGEVIKTVHNRNSKVSFSLRYSRRSDVGTHYYTMREVNGGNPNVVYDTSTYDFVVEVSETGGMYSAKVLDKYTPIFNNYTYVPEVSSEPEEPSSEPVIEPSEPSAEPSVTPSEPEKQPEEVKPIDKTPQTSDEGNLSFWLVILAVSAVGLVVALFFEKRNRYHPKHYR